MKKSIMLLLLSLLPVFSSARPFKITQEERRNQEQENENLDGPLIEGNLKLIGKHFENTAGSMNDLVPPASEWRQGVPTSAIFERRRTVLFFDTDGDTNTTEVVAAKYCPCLLTEAKIFDAKVGDTKTSLEWRDAMKHKNEDRCAGRETRHRLVFEDARLPPIFPSDRTFKTTRGKGKRIHEKENKRLDHEFKKKNLTLIGKQFENIFNNPDVFENPDGPANGVFTRRTVFFFDTDGDVNTAEVVAAKYCPCLLSEAKIFDAKIGDAKTALEWQDALKHWEEDRCDERKRWGLGSLESKQKLVWGLERRKLVLERHKLVWDLERQ